MWTIDQFADRDLTRVAGTWAICPPDGYPDAIPELAKQFPPGPVLYTGGLENHPHVVAELMKTRELWGNPPDVLARVRDPFVLFPLLNDAGFRTPQLVPRGAPCPTAGRWLRKPRASGGGIGIRFAEPGEAASPLHDFQEWVEGTPLSAVFGGTTLLGVTEQLIGEPWLHAEPFAYCGTVGPRTVPPLVTTRCLHLGRSLVGSVGVCGHWGVDFLLADRACAVEINPRYAASVEVLEHAAGCSAFRPWLPGRTGPERVVGKAIYYAPHAVTFPSAGPWDADLAGAFDPWRLPGYADIPDPGSAIRPGWPVLTFFAAGRTPAEVRERLKSRAAELDRLFAEHAP
ncbi:ATP-grasp domain-containing protein [Gemmata sp. JC717]|uniref:ATP-grasp domain-containing protein n=1 Tax=Gemmata algarum TaxID=2975278 RepID=UPI0021BB5A38|nr:ATP-grasp domain-containing protein [Gemmata algarum]MDY3553232.1 ATP-grasp domain-containing protein [Gemmata algarum]